MATLIKSIPVLKDKVALSFINKINVTATKKASIDFSAQTKITAGILKKAKI